MDAWDEFGIFTDPWIPLIFMVLRKYTTHGSYGVFFIICSPPQFSTLENMAFIACMSHVVFPTARFVTALMSYGSIQRMEEAIFGEPCCTKKYVDVSENNGTPKSSSLIGFSIINHVHPFLGYPYFWKHPNMYLTFLSFLKITKHSGVF